MDKVLDVVVKDHSVDDNVSWSAYHTSQCTKAAGMNCVNALLPLFHESANTVAMIRHSLNVINQEVRHTNPGQTIVVTADHPLYALTKEIQWLWPDTYGETKFVLLMGGLHIEMASLRVLCDWLDGSGWCRAIEEAKVTTSGRADAMIGGKHVTRTRWAHQVTAAALYALLHMTNKQRHILVV